MISQTKNCKRIQPEEKIERTLKAVQTEITRFHIFRVKPTVIFRESLSSDSSRRHGPSFIRMSAAFAADNKLVFYAPDGNTVQGRQTGDGETDGIIFTKSSVVQVFVGEI